jgi:phosphatidylserine/phosphatidylglycerophosphate/cardiolipin synthase-like enzyme
MMRIVSRQLAADYANEFEQMFEGRFGTSKRSSTPYSQVQIGAARIEVYFSPEDGVAQHVLERLKSARSSIRFMAFSFTSAPIADALVAKARAGLSVRGVFE